MNFLLRLFSYFLELAIGVLTRVARILFVSIAFNPRLGPLRHLATASVAYVLFAFLLVYVAAPIRGYIGHLYMGEKIRYDAERWLATAIYDRQGQFIGTFDPRLDSQRDVNWTDAPIWSPILRWTGLAGPIDPYRGFALTNICILTFFDRYLKADTASPVCGLSGDKSEVRLDA